MARRREWFAVQMILTSGMTYDLNFEFRTFAAAVDEARKIASEAPGKFRGHSVFTVTEVG